MFHSVAVFFKLVGNVCVNPIMFIPPPIGGLNAIVYIFLIISSSFILCCITSY